MEYIWLRVREKIVEIFFKWYVRAPNHLNRGWNCQQGRALKVPCSSSLLINLLIATSQAGPGQGVREQKLEVRALYQQV